MTFNFKFDDCKTCIHRGGHNRKQPSTCRDCDFGEFYENEEEATELSFDNDNQAFNRADKSLTTDDDEPYHNPDDYIHQIDQNDDDPEEYDEEF